MHTLMKTEKISFGTLVLKLNSWFPKFKYWGPKDAKIKFGVAKFFQMGLP